MSRLKTGGYAPLFDRLEHPFEKKEIAHWLDIKQLERSVSKEITRLAHTRSRLTFDEYLNNKDLTVLDYGIPDFYGSSVQNSDSRNKIYQVLIKALKHFEPRIRNVEINYLEDIQNTSELKFQISGDLQTNKSIEPVTFLIASEANLIHERLGEDTLVD